MLRFSPEEPGTLGLRRVGQVGGALPSKLRLALQLPALSQQTVIRVLLAQPPVPVAVAVEGSSCSLGEPEQI